MLELKSVREDPAAVRAAIASKGEAGALAVLDELLAADAHWRALLGETEALRAERNALSAQVGRLKKGGGDAPAALAEVLERGARAAERLQGLEAGLATAAARVRELLLQLPNQPDPEVPRGPDASGNVEVERVGCVPPCAFPPRAHWTLGADLGLLDFERAGKITGARFTVFTGRGARLVRALTAFMLDLHVTRHRCAEVLPPFLVNSASMLGTGNLPKFGEDAFRIEGRDYWLVPTAEVPVTNLYRDELLSWEALPIRHVAHTPCWRSEAGAAGRDTRGLVRQHQFDKVEIVHFVAPERSEEHLGEIVAAAGAVLQALRLPYRVVEICSGDLGFAAARKFDLEVWMPSYDRYVEISSCSNFRAFQARRANIRVRRATGRPPEYVHTLNGSALAVGRTIAALLENGQQADGAVQLPEALGPYLGGDLLWR